MNAFPEYGSGVASTRANTFRESRYSSMDLPHHATLRLQYQDACPGYLIACDG